MKRNRVLFRVILRVLLAAVVCFGCFGATEATNIPERVVSLEETVVGDVNLDGVLDSNDARCLLLNVVDVSRQLTNAEKEAADINADGRVDSVDARKILVMIVREQEKTPLYSFGLMSDLHLQYATGQSDFSRALAYFEQQQLPFSCVCGDLSWAATMVNAEAYTSQWKGGLADYKDIKGDRLVYAIGGNHETYTATYDVSAASWHSVGTGFDTALWKEMTGNEPFYTVSNQPDNAQTHNVCQPTLPDSDVFIMLSIKHASAPNLWLEGEWEWLQATMEANADKRCFVFFHQHDNADKTADPYGLYPHGISEATAQGKAFIDLMRQYDNVIWFHGHTHTTFLETQPAVQDDEERGYVSVHVPSLQGPRKWNPETGGFSGWADRSECYVAEVYVNRIVFKALDMTTVDADGIGEATLLETYTIYMD